MPDLLTTLLKLPLGFFLIVTGIVFLFIAVAGKIADKIDPGRIGRIISGTVGTILIITGLLLSLRPIPPPGPSPLTPGITPTHSPTLPVVVPLPNPQEVAFQNLYNSYTTSKPVTIAYSLLTNTGINTVWEQVPYSNKACSFTPGPYHLQSWQYGGKSFFCYGDPKASFSNFVYTVQETVAHGDGSIIIFRASAEFQDFFRFEVHIDGTYAYSIGSLRGNGASSYIHQGRNVSNILGVVAQGTNIALFCNGKIVRIVPDTVRTSGSIGVGADAYSENAYVSFSYAQIWQLT